MKRNWEGLVLKALGGKDFRLTVVESTSVNGRYQRVLLTDGGLLRRTVIHPTMWVRLWFAVDGRPHQRAYTLVDPEPETGRFSLEFALHDGAAARWAQTARPGDTIDATLQGSAFTMPPDVRRMYLIGDPASLPAINSLLDSAPATPATVWLEYAHDDDKGLPVRARADQHVTWVPRLLDTVLADLPAEHDALYWVAAEASHTRAITRHLRHTLGAPKHHVKSLAYWTAS